MPPDSNLETARRRAYELVGRTVLRYQGLELLFKRLLELSHIQIEGLDVSHPNKAGPRTSMGLAAKALFQSVIVPLSEGAPPYLDNELGDSNDPTMKATFRIQPSAEVWSAWRDRLNRVIDARNDLIHHSLTRMNLGTVEGCESAIAELESFGAALPGELKFLQSLCENARLILRQGIESGFDELSDQLVERDSCAEDVGAPPLPSDPS